MSRIPDFRDLELGDSTLSTDRTELADGAAAAAGPTEREASDRVPGIG